MDILDQAVYDVETDEDFNEFVGNVGKMLQQESETTWYNELDAPKETVTLPFNKEKNDEIRN